MYINEFFQRYEQIALPGEIRLSAENSSFIFHVLLKIFCVEIQNSVNNFCFKAEINHEKNHFHLSQSLVKYNQKAHHKHFFYFRMTPICLAGCL